MSEWFNPSDKLPRLGEVVLVQCVVRYGRKRRVMAAKRIDTSWENCPEDWCWIALKDESEWTLNIKLKEVFHWRFLPMVTQGKIFIEQEQDA